MDAKPERHGQPKSGRGIFFEFLRQIHQIEPVGRTCKGGVKPTVEVFSKHFFRDIADIQKDVHPLAALCLVAGDGIGIFNEDLLSFFSSFLPLSGHRRNLREWYRKACH